MSRGTRARRAKRRARKASIKPPPPREPEGPTNWELVGARFCCLRGRGVKFGFVLWGPAVEARTPAELEANTAIALARLLKDEPKN